MFLTRTCLNSSRTESQYVVSVRAQWSEGNTAQPKEPARTDSTRPRYAVAVCLPTVRDVSTSYWPKVGDDHNREGRTQGSGCQVETFCIRALCRPHPALAHIGCTPCPQPLRVLHRVRAERPSRGRWRQDGSAASVCEVAGLTAPFSVFQLECGRLIFLC